MPQRSTEALIRRVLGRHRKEDLLDRLEIRRVLKRHWGSNKIVALAVKSKRAGKRVTGSAVSIWLSGGMVSHPIHIAAHRVAKVLLKKEAEEREERDRLRAERLASKSQEAVA